MTNRLYQEAAVGLQLKLTAMDCAECGIIFAVTAELDKRRRADGGNFFCPNGHALSYGDSALDRAKRRAEKLAAEVERQKGWRAQAEASWQRECDEHRQTRKTLGTVRGQLTRIRKTATAGLCPFGCRRHFANLERHVLSKHAGETLPEEEGSS